MKIKAISPSAYNLFWSNADQYYLRYLAEDQYKDKGLTTDAMLAGTAFDIHVKAALCKDLMKVVPDNMLLHNQLEKQVEDKTIYPRILEIGQELLDFYKSCGAYAELLNSISKSIVSPVFEFYVNATVKGVPLKGFPDAFWVSESGLNITADWKVNGYYSKGAPKKGYVKDHTGGKRHKNCLLTKYKGVAINIGCMFEDISVDWAVQQCIYNWAMGSPVGSDFIIMLEQIACNPHRCFSYKSLASRQFQKELLLKLQIMWEIIQSDHFYRGNLGEYIRACKENNYTLIPDFSFTINKEQSNMKIKALTRLQGDPMIRMLRSSCFDH